MSKSFAKLIAIAWNDIRIEFSERSTLIFFLLLPLLFTVVIGLGLQGLYGSDGSETDDRFVVVVVDEDQSALSQRLLAVLEASRVSRPLQTSADTGRAYFEREEVPALLTIPKGFEESLLANQPASLELLSNPGNSQSVAVAESVRAAASQVGSAVAVAHSSLAEAESIRPFASEDERKAYFNQALEAAQTRLADPPARSQGTQSPEVTIDIATGFEQSSPGQVVTWTLITLVGAAEVFVYERNQGTLRRLLVMPTHKAVILTGKILGRLAMGLLQMAILIGFGGVFLHVNWGRSPAALTIMCLAFGLAAVALGVMLGALVRTLGQASGLTVMFSMLFSALGGAWWPLEVTPPAYQAVVKVLPTTWAMTGFSDVILRGQAVAGILPEAGVLLAFAVLFFSIGLWRLRFE